MNTIKTFTGTGDFEASRAAEQWLRDRNFSFGPSQADGPQAIWHGASSVSKWRNLSAQERKAAHGVLESSRNGQATITLRKNSPPAARAAFLTQECMLEILHHMLGATPHQNSDQWGSRNHYVANRQDVPRLAFLQEAGMVFTGAALLDLRYYHATEWGCRVAGLDDAGVARAAEAMQKVQA